MEWIKSQTAEEYWAERSRKRKPSTEPKIIQLPDPWADARPEDLNLNRNLLSLMQGSVSSINSSRNQRWMERLQQEGTGN